MASLFPGMDPFLESPAFWPDFHSTFINYWREALADDLPDEFEVNVGERVYLVEQDPDARKLIYPDLALLEGERLAKEPVGGLGGIGLLEPVTIPVTILEGARDTFIEILHKPDHSLIAVLELLSPANKEQPGRTEDLHKRQALLYQKVHLVELDLLMGGRPLPMGKTLPAGDYHYFVHRAEQRPDCQVYSWNLRQPLDRFPVPLRPPYPDLSFDLAAVFTTAYDRGRFARRIPYRAPCPAPLNEGDRKWVDEVLQKGHLTN
jgi:Protein of unknown function (DUF4058)